MDQDGKNCCYLTCRPERLPQASEASVRTPALLPFDFNRLDVVTPLEL